MSKIPFIPWLVGLIVLVGGAAGLSYFVSASGSMDVARWIALIGVVLASAWITLALWRWREATWVVKISRLVITTLIAAALYFLAGALDFVTAQIIILGIWAMAVGFMVGMELLRLLLSPGTALLGVARTVLDEAIRMRLALIFVVMVILLVPLLPFMLGGETRLQYRIESFLTYALTVVSTLLSFMTILLAVRTVSSEMTERQAYLTLTKPIGRVQYLVGKWLGIMSLNLVLLGVSAVGIYAFVQVLERQPAMDRLDAAAVQEQVVTARASTSPTAVDPEGLASMYRARLRELRQREPETFGRPDDPLDTVAAEQQQQVYGQVLRDWLTIREGDSQTYRFAGLEAAKDVAPTVQLRLKPKAAGSTDDERLQLGLRVNGRPYPPLPRIRDNTFHTLYIPTEAINEDGHLDITVTNGGGDAPDQPTVSFNPTDGMELFYRVGGFAGNLIKGTLMLWVRLSFLAMVGLGAATFLGFPVACLLSFLIYFSAVGSGYIGESLSSYASLPKNHVPGWDSIWLVVGKFRDDLVAGEFWDAFKLIVRLVGEMFTAIIPSFGEYSPTERVAYGRVVTWSDLGWATLKIGIIWTGIIGAIAAAIFSKREIARVTV